MCKIFQVLLHSIVMNFEANNYLLNRWPSGYTRVSLVHNFLFPANFIFEKSWLSEKLINPYDVRLSLTSNCLQYKLPLLFFFLNRWEIVIPSVIFHLGVIVYWSMKRAHLLLIYKCPVAKLGSKAGNQT